MSLARFSLWVPVGRLESWLAAPVDPQEARWLEVELVEEYSEVLERC
jgi:hypothetical protein